MDQITARIWLGSLEDAQSPLAQSSMAATLNLCEHRYPTSLAYWHLPMPDEVFLAPSVWQVRVDALTNLQLSLVTTLVHCRLGVSRSPSLVAAYLASIGAYDTPDAALDFLQRRRACVNPHPDTWRGVLHWWEQRQKGAA